MIHYSLLCEHDHAFDGWFRDSAAFDRQVAAREIACPDCGSRQVRKALMAPRLARTRQDADGTKKPERVALGTAPEDKTELMEKLRTLRRHVEANAEHVGERFAEEARRMHYRETEPRGIYGSASVEEAVALEEEGIEVFALPVLPEDRN